MPLITNPSRPNLETRHSKRVRLNRNFTAPVHLTKSWCARMPKLYAGPGDFYPQGRRVGPNRAHGDGAGLAEG